MEGMNTIILLTWWDYVRGCLKPPRSMKPSKSLSQRLILDVQPIPTRADDRYYACHLYYRTPLACGRLDTAGGRQSTRPRDAPTPSGATIRTRPAHTTRATAGRSDALDRAHSRGTRGTAAAPVGGITLAARKPVVMACHACRPSDRCICSSHRHVRMHGSHARKEHAVTIAGSSVPAVSDAQDDNTLDPRRSGAAQVARDAPLQPDARVERSERWLLCAAHDRYTRCVGEVRADAPQVAPGPLEMLGHTELRRPRVLVAILRHGGHIARSARRMDWCSWCAAPCVRRVLRQRLLFCSSIAPVLPARFIRLQQAGHAPGQRSARSARRG